MARKITWSRAIDKKRDHLGGGGRGKGLILRFYFSQPIFIIHFPKALFKSIQELLSSVCSCQDDEDIRHQR